ncbi:MAG TPA: right-handed parallel beta-helix repeat-containing protein, partial [Anaerolineales bacterium]|nr:right-handed parallel beta-helix repeat-containing protein [Anaerolineales bacterium]
FRGAYDVGETNPWIPGSDWMPYGLPVLKTMAESEAFAKKIRPGSILAEINITGLPSGHVSQSHSNDHQLLLPTDFPSRIYHVSMGGKDSNPGTQASPFRTLKRASEVLHPGDICIVHEGTYRECFKPVNSGTAEKPIVLKAADGEKVILSGLEALSDWQQSGDGIYKAKASWDLGELNFVLIDGKMGFEARFPNKTNDDPLDIEGGTIIEEGVSKLPEGEDLPTPVRFISETSLPVQWTTRDLSEAKVWVLAHRKWSAWTAPVTGYNPKEQLIWFKEFPGNQIASNYNPNWLQTNYGRGRYYMFGSKVLLDTPNEWYFDKKAKELYVMVSGRKKPAKGQVEFRKREAVVDLRDKEFWEISGFEIEGATIDMSTAENCTVNDCKISNVWQSVPAQSARAMTARSSGITIGGENNTIKNSEISYSAGAGITLSGQNNRVANNLIHHTNYLGSISTGAMRVSGFNNQIIYNTIHTTGRDIIKLHGAGGVVAWNHLYNPGLICYDLGIIYSGGQDYRNTLIHHNLVHNDHFDHHPCNGIYFDNYTNNGIVHHNIIWGNIRTGVRLNRPGNFHQVFNNTTVSIDNRYGPWEGPSVQFGSSIVNNYSVSSIVANEEVFHANNAQGFPYDTQKRLPQVTEPSKGFANFGFLDYIGAISNNSENWTAMAGHDFDRSSIDPVDRDLPFMRNYINNGSFDWGRGRDGNPADNTLGKFWKKSGEAELSYSPGFHQPAPSIRKSVHANSLLLKSDDAGISQTVKGLQPNFPYKVGVYVRPYENAEAIMSVQSSAVTKEVSSKEVAPIEGWKLLVLAFRTGPEDTEVTVRIGKTGEGDVYLDNIGLVPDLVLSYR